MANGEGLGIEGVDMSQIAGWATQAGTILILVVLVSLFVTVVTLVMVTYKKKKLYEKYKVVIYKRYKTEEGKTIPVIEDISERGAVIKDKKMNKWVFHLKKNNIDMGEEEMENFDENRELDIPTVPYSRGGEVVFLEKLGTKKFAFGTPKFEGDITVKVTEADLAEAKRSYSLFVKTFSKKPNPIWAFAIYIIFAILVLVMIAIVLNKFELIVSASENFAKGAQAVGAGNQDVVPSGVPV